MTHADRGAGADIHLIVPNFNRRYSGVTAVNRTLAPLLARRCRVEWIGAWRPDGIASVSLGQLLRRRFGAASRQRAVWHARRNIEMLAGVLLKWLGFPFALVFTSAAQRHHSWITRFLIARMDAVIATSEAAASYLKRPATVIHHGADAERYHPPQDREAEWRAAGLPGRYGIGCFGRVREQKGTDVFVDAMCALLPRHPDFTAVIVGEITAEQHAFGERLKAKAAAGGLGERIRFVGYLPADEVPIWFRRLTIYAFTSRNEGFGLTLLEAMASGNAVVASRAGAAEIAVADGETGLLVPPGDVAATVAALETLMRDPEAAAAMGQRGRERVLARFSINAEVEAHLGVYRAVLKGAAPAPR